MALVFLAVAFVAAAGYVHRQRIARQWMVYRVGTAVDFERACEILAWFEAGPNREKRLSTLVARFGAGNARFDLHLARYVASPASSEALRKRFGLELAWREGLLARWAHFWCWRAGEQAPHRVEEIVEYAEMLLAAEDAARTITWREILDLQAIFCLSGAPQWAERLTPENWRERYTKWRNGVEPRSISVRHRSKPFPDWEGPDPW